MKKIQISLVLLCGCLRAPNLISSTPSSQSCPAQQAKSSLQSPRIRSALLTLRSGRDDSTPAVHRFHSACCRPLRAPCELPAGSASEAPANRVSHLTPAPDAALYAET